MSCDLYSAYVKPCGRCEGCERDRRLRSLGVIAHVAQHDAHLLAHLELLLQAPSWDVEAVLTWLVLAMLEAKAEVWRAWKRDLALGRVPLRIEMAPDLLKGVLAQRHPPAAAQPPSPATPVGYDAPLEVLELLHAQRPSAGEQYGAMIREEAQRRGLDPLPPGDDLAQQLRAAGVLAPEGGLPSQGYELVTEEGRQGIRCLTCGATSFLPADVAQRYCGRCHRFHKDPA